MEFNPDGTISRSSVRHLKRVLIKLRDGEQIRYALARVRSKCKIKVGEIAVIDEREWLRLSPCHNLSPYYLNGTIWIEINKLR